MHSSLGHRRIALKRTIGTKATRELVFLVGLLISSCAEPDMQTAELQRAYARRGEEMTPTINKVEQRNPQRGTTPHLSTTNTPVRQ
jgi:hypothetical protein